jgi:predicted transcriptional regulator
MFAKIMSSCGSCEPYLTFRDVKYFLGDECFKECIGKETYEKLKQLYSDNVDDEADKEITATAIGSPLMRSIFDLVEDAKELYKECEKLMNVKEENNNEGNSDS